MCTMCTILLVYCSSDSALDSDCGGRKFDSRFRRAVKWSCILPSCLVALEKKVICISTSSINKDFPDGPVEPIVKPDLQLLEHDCSQWITKANSIAKRRVNVDVLRNSYSTSAIYSIKPELDRATQIVNSIDYNAISDLYLSMADFMYSFVIYDYSTCASR